MRLGCKHRPHFSERGLGFLFGLVSSTEDHLEMEVMPPFGQENIIVYTSTCPLGDISGLRAGGVYKIKTDPGDIGVRSRGVILKEINPAQKTKAAEFSESQIIYKIGK